VQLDLGDGPI